ncbi:hypothetical protein ACHAXA_003983 [Cyclostephanos tholiformis]|uniref:Uncharacterized protein n=1 Tax=Cyclostephanos tholiformis TaxID=382380 RepID=A0ABD3R3R4_9STRA
MPRLHNKRLQSGKTTPPEHSPKWEKLFAITKAMYTSATDWLLWLDCDAAFTNFDIDWRVHLRDHLDKSRVLVASRDISGINLGVFLVPNTPYSRFFVEMMSEERYDIERRQLSHKDQNALKNLLTKSPQLACSIDDSVPQGMINSYLDNPAGHQWMRNDWIAHQVFCESRDCPDRFLSFLRSVGPDP